MVADLQPRIHVSVFDGAQFVETRLCHGTTTPDGRPAVLYRGLVHSVEDGGRIDLSLPAFIPREAAPPVEPAPRCSIVRGETSGYALIKGSVVEREAAASNLRELGAKVDRTGRYLGEATGGVSPDWFIRFDLNDATFEEIERAFCSGVGSSGVGAETSEALRIALLEREVARLGLRAASLEAEAARLRLERTEARVAAAEADAAALARLEAERAALQEALIAESRAREAAEARAARSSTPVARADAPQTLIAEIRTVLGAVAPRARLVRDTLAFLAVEVRDRGPIYRALAQLETATLSWPSGWKKLQVAIGWWERHVSDGASDAGRLYARIDPQDRSVEVLASTKGEQARDIAWLRRN